VELIEKQLVEKLEQTWNLRRFSALGEAFDPNRHEAVLSEVGDTDVAVVTEEYQKGYFLHERVVRPAKVKVMVPRASETIAAPSTEPAPENSN
jgi:molecular chaperone GrpE